MHKGIQNLYKNTERKLKAPQVVELLEGVKRMKEKQDDEGELTLWVLYSIHRSRENNLPTETSFIYARNDEEAKEIVERWTELHPDYLLQRYEPRPDGFIKDGTFIPGKKQPENRKTKEED